MGVTDKPTSMLQTHHPTTNFTPGRQPDTKMPSPYTGIHSHPCTTAHHRKQELHLDPKVCSSQGTLGATYMYKLLQHDWCSLSLHPPPPPPPHSHILHMESKCENYDRSSYMQIQGVTYTRTHIRTHMQHAQRERESTLTNK